VDLPRGLARLVGPDRARRASTLRPRNLVRQSGAHRPDQRDPAASGETGKRAARAAGPMKSIDRRRHLSQEGQGSDARASLLLGHRSVAPRPETPRAIAPGVGGVLMSAKRDGISRTLVVRLGCTLLLLPPNWPELDPVANVCRFTRDNCSHAGPSTPSMAHPAIIMSLGTGSPIKPGAACLSASAGRAQRF
jgi:hypothetical protein